jgi:ATPase family AAA domain-containing protein 1
MAPDRGRFDRWWFDFGLTILTLAGGYYTFKYLITQMTFDPDSEQKKEARLKSAAILRRLDTPRPEDSDAEDEPQRRPRREDLELNQYEQAILQNLVFPEDINISFEDIGGLSHIIEDLREAVIYPLTTPNLFYGASSLLSAPSGVLLYGPPGCGKTMLAKALAHESGAHFINLHISTLTEKWFGDSNKLVHAVFTLARKLEPAIVFIDEIDAVLGTRRSGEHEASNMVKAEFMTHWDGLASTNASGRPQRILILGATNRIHDIDEAILRRMPKKFAIGLPALNQRLKILKIILKDTKVDPSRLDLDSLSRAMAGMSGSEIKEACREAAMIPVREMIQKQMQSGQRLDQMRPGHVRGLRTEDFFVQNNGRERARQRNKSSTSQADKEWKTDSSSEGVDSPRSEMQDAEEEILRGVEGEHVRAIS